MDPGSERVITVSRRREPMGHHRWNHCKARSLVVRKKWRLFCQRAQRLLGNGWKENRTNKTHRNFQVIYLPPSKMCVRVGAILKQHVAVDNSQKTTLSERFFLKKDAGGCH